MEKLHQIAKVKRLGLGNNENVYRNKSLSIRLNRIKVSKGINTRNITIYLNVFASNLSSQNATIYVMGEQEFFPSIMIPIVKKTIRKDGVTDVEIIFTHNINPFTSDEFGDIYKAHVLCDSLIAESSEFTIDLADTESAFKTCFCNRPFTDSEFKKIVIDLRKQEVIEKNGRKIRDINGRPILKNGKEQFRDLTQYDVLDDKLFYLNKPEKLREEDANFKKFTQAINKTFKDYEISSCIRKIHFLAQCYHETQRFTLTYEENPSPSVSGGPFYRGRGLIQLTHDYNYLKLQQKVNDNSSLSTFVPRVAQEIDLACQASGYYWKNLGIKKVNINLIADKDNILTVSKEINGYKENNVVPNGYNDRVLFTNLLKEIFDYEKCKNNK